MKKVSRTSRLNGEYQKEISEIIRLHKDRMPGVTGLISITEADVAPDLRNATVYFSCMGDSKEALEGLKKCTGILRHHLAVTLNLRITPELRFIKDGSIEHGAKIARLLEQTKTEKKEENEDN